MEGFNSEHNATSYIAVADKGITTLDAAARLLLETFVHVDQTTNKIAFKAGGFEIESSELSSYFRENRHLAALKRMVEIDYLDRLTSGHEMLILAVDEADKAPVPLAQLVRSIVTHTQHRGIKNVRFVLAGVRPFFQQMVAEDPGIQRFFYKIISLRPMRRLDAHDLIETKLIEVVRRAEESGVDLGIETTLTDRIVALSGGHPHILQLLGSHLVENEDEDPDGLLDSKDLLNSFRRVCYDDRGSVYEAMVHNLEVNGRLDLFRGLLGLTAESPQGIVSQSFPTKIDRRLSLQVADKATMQWFVEQNVLVPSSKRKYGLVDEFLRVRLILEESLLVRTGTDIETTLLESALLPSEALAHESELTDDERGERRPEVEDLLMRILGMTKKMREVMNLKECAVADSHSGSTPDLAAAQGDHHKRYLARFRKPWLTLPPVVTALRRRHAEDVRRIWSKSVWIVGASEASTENSTRWGTQPPAIALRAAEAPASTWLLRGAEVSWRVPAGKDPLIS